MTTLMKGLNFLAECQMYHKTFCDSKYLKRHDRQGGVLSNLIMYAKEMDCCVLESLAACTAIFWDKHAHTSSIREAQILQVPWLMLWDKRTW